MKGFKILSDDPSSRGEEPTDSVHNPENFRSGVLLILIALIAFAALIFFGIKFLL